MKRVGRKIFSSTIDVTQAQQQANIAFGSAFQQETDDFVAAAADNNLGGIQSFLAKYPDKANTTSTNGRTALTAAAQNGRYQIVAYLIEKKVDVNVTDRALKTALIHAAQEGQEDILTLLLAQQPELNAAGPNGWTALICAAGIGHFAITEKLLKAGADPVLQDIGSRNAATITQNDAVRALLEDWMKNREALLAAEKNKTKQAAMLRVLAHLRQAQPKLT